MTGAILCVNAGSSSLKLALMESDGTALLRGSVMPGGAGATRLAFHDADGRDTVVEPVPADSHPVVAALAALDRHGAPSVSAVGHRVVHGGVRHSAPVRVDGALLGELRELADLAPLHMPPQVAAIEAVAAADSGMAQVACFDTAFHRAMPEEAQRLPLPEWAWERGIRRFGFHGLSFEHVVTVLGPGSGRVVVAHLGNGASMAALRDGVPVDTTMAFTPTAGLMMGTRSGDLDPGLVLHLVLRTGMAPERVEHLITHESGLLGVSGTTSDMRALLAARACDPRAELAVAMFCRSARRSLGAMVAMLGGIDQFVFTGGIGEHAPAVRAGICAGLEHLGVGLDPARNADGAPFISPRDASCAVRIVAADEERVIARHTARLVHPEVSGA